MGRRRAASLARRGGGGGEVRQTASHITGNLTVERNRQRSALPAVHVTSNFRKLVTSNTTSVATYPYPNPPSAQSRGPYGTVSPYLQSHLRLGIAPFVSEILRPGWFQPPTVPPGSGPGPKLGPGPSGSESPTSEGSVGPARASSDLALGATVVADPPRVGPGETYTSRTGVLAQNGQLDIKASTSVDLPARAAPNSPTPKTLHALQWLDYYCKSDSQPDRQPDRQPTSVYRFIGVRQQESSQRPQ